MAVVTREITLKSGPGMQVIDITEQAGKAVRESGLKEGIACIFVPGSTASITTTEYEPNLNKDLKAAAERLVPSGMEYEHTKTWGDSNGHSHVRASLFGPGISVPFRDRKIILGQWQQVVLLDFDVPARDRKVIIQLVGD